MQRFIAVLLFACLVTPAAAQSRVAPGRYVLVPVEAGALRLDTETGEVSRCAGNADAASCTPMAEVGGADDIAVLKDRVAKLEARVAALEARTTISVPMPDEESMDRVMALTDHMMRRFFDMVRDMKRDSERDDL